MTLPNVPKDANMPEAVRGWLERVKREIEAAFSSIGDLVIPTAASEAEAETGTAADKYISPLTAVASVKTFSPFVNFAYFEDRKSTNTQGGSATTGYQTRTLNTEVVNTISGCSLSSSQVTLPAGTYLVEGSCPAGRVNRHKCRLYNVTTGNAIAYGTSAFGAVGSGLIVVTRSEVLTKFTLGSSTVIRLEHQVQDQNTTADYGEASNLTGVEVYSTLKIWKLD
jgi:hypothetical protein